MIDKETNVLEKRFFNYLADLEIDRATRYQNFVTLFYLEPDLEPDNGATLDTLAKILKEEFRTTDIIGRINHVRFGVILLYSDLQRSIVAGERLRKRIEDYLFSEKKKRTISLGGACFPINVTNSEDLISLAGRMLKLAKNKGGNTLCFPVKEDS